MNSLYFLYTVVGTIRLYFLYIVIGTIALRFVDAFTTCIAVEWFGILETNERYQKLFNKFGLVKSFIILDIFYISIDLSFYFLYAFFNTVHPEFIAFVGWFVFWLILCCKVVTQNTSEIFRVQAKRRS